MKFLLTPELGRLAKWLRAMGHDAALFKGRTPDLLAKATAEGRTILTRLTSLQGHKGTPVVSIQSDQLQKQLKELKKLRGIQWPSKNLFSRCIVCNVPVEAVAKERAKGKVPPHVFQTQDNFSYCPQCRRIYWNATHWERASNFLRTI